MNKQQFNMPAATLEHCLEIKKSRFICRLSPAEDRRQALAIVAAARRDYPDARHHCWAYQLGSPLQPISQASNDDGEPSGTAGKPILNVLQHSDVGNITAVVIRYFGGIKLGAGGLVRAYSAVTSQAMEQLALTLWQARSVLDVSGDYCHEAALRQKLVALGGQVLSVDYSQGLTLRLQIPQSSLPELQNFCHGSRGLQTILR